MSKSADTVASISNKKQKVENEEELGDHGQLMPGSLTQQKKSSATPPVNGRESVSPRRGARPTPRMRTFHEDSDEHASDPVKLRALENSAPVPLLGQPGYLAHNRTRGRGGKGGGGGGVSTTEDEELQEDWDAALGRRSGTKASLTTLSSSSFRASSVNAFEHPRPPSPPFNAIMVGVTSRSLPFSLVPLPSKPPLT